MAQSAIDTRQVTLLDLLDRILNKGVILYGDLCISVADVDLVYVGLWLLVASVETAHGMKRDAYAELVPGSREEMSLW